MVSEESDKNMVRQTANQESLQGGKTSQKKIWTITTEETQSSTSKETNKGKVDKQKGKGCGEQATQETN